MQRPIIPYTEARLSKLDAGHIIKYPDPGHNKKYDNYYAVPSFLIIGAMKCGTTELTHWLLKHPNLKGTHREWHFFDEVIDIHTEWNRYVLSPHFTIKNRFHSTADQSLHTFEKTTEYFDKQNRGIDIPAIVKKMMPSGKFIVMLRDPVARAYSSYRMNNTAKKTRPVLPDYARTSFPEAIQDFFARGEASNFYRDFDTGHYAEHLKRWLGCFSRQQLLIVFMENFKDNPFKVMDQIQHFLNLPLFNYQKITRRDHEGLWRLSNNPTKNHYHQYPQMSEDTRKLLEDYYQPWNQKLQALVPELNIPWILS